MFFAFFLTFLNFCSFFFVPHFSSFFLNVSSCFSFFLFDFLHFIFSRLFVFVFFVFVLFFHFFFSSFIHFSSFFIFPSFFLYFSSSFLFSFSSFFHFFMFLQFFTFFHFSSKRRKSHLPDFTQDLSRSGTSVFLLAFVSSSSPFHPLREEKYDPFFALSPPTCSSVLHLFLLFLFSLSLPLLFISFFLSSPPFNWLF